MAVICKYQSLMNAYISDDSISKPIERLGSTKFCIMLSLVMVTRAHPRKRGFNMLSSINKTKISPINLP